MDDLPDTVKKCLDILDENLEILSNIEFNLNDEKNDELVPDMKLHHLYDMTEDVAETEKVYFTPFFKPLKITGLSVALINSPV